MRTEAESLELLNLLEQKEREKVAPKFDAWRKPARYKIGWGGRGAGSKSWSSVSLIVQAANQRTLRIACLREIQKSLDESVYALIRDTIVRLKYDGWVIKKNSIENTRNGSRFIFRGLKDMRAASQIKSLESYDIFFVEEAATITHKSWSVLMPTLRKKGSELWAVFNREEELDPVYERFVVNERKDSIILHLLPGPADNPWWYNTTLPGEMEEDFKYDEDEAIHVWHGEPRKQGHKSAVSRARTRHAMDRILVDPEGGVTVGCDPARFGDDKTQIYIRKGLKVIGHKEIKKQDGVFVAQEIATMIKSDPSIPIRVDTTGIGASVVDQLRVLRLKTIPIDNAQKANDPDKYPNAISEMWFNFSDIIDEVDIPDDPELMRELAGRQYDYNTKSQRVIEPKKKFKERYGKSPDKGDALLLCFYQGGSIMMSNQDQEDMAARRGRGR